METAKGINALIQKNRVLFWKGLSIIVGFISVSGVPRFQSVLNSEVSLSITLALLKSIERADYYAKHELKY